MNEVDRATVASACGFNWWYVYGDTILHYGKNNSVVWLKAWKQNAKTGKYHRVQWLASSRVTSNFASQYLWAKKWDVDPARLLANWNVELERTEPKHPMTHDFRYGRKRSWHQIVSNKVVSLHWYTYGSGRGEIYPRVHRIDDGYYDYELSHTLQRDLNQGAIPSRMLQFMTDPETMLETTMMEAAL